MDPFTGTPYRLIGLLGQGGMGEVYEVEHEGVGTRLVAKVLLQEFADDAVVVDRMRVEAHRRRPCPLKTSLLAAAVLRLDRKIFVASRIVVGCLFGVLLCSACGGEASGSPAPSAECLNIVDQICAKWTDVGGNGEPCNPPGVSSGVDFTVACEKAGEKCPYPAADIVCPADAGT